MKVILIVLLCFIALTSVTSGLLMISLPAGKVLRLTYPGQPPVSAHMLLPGVLLTCSVGLVTVIALVYNIRRFACQFSWAIAAGCINICRRLIKIFFLSMPGWIDAVYAFAGIGEVLIACQLKGFWAV